MFGLETTGKHLSNIKLSAKAQNSAEAINTQRSLFITDRIRPNSGISGI
jgi:hypothetical protein